MIDLFTDTMMDDYVARMKPWNDAVSEWLEECRAQDAAEELLYGPEINEAAPDDRAAIDP